MYPAKSHSVASPAKWMLPSRAPSIPENPVIWSGFQYGHPPDPRVVETEVVPRLPVVGGLHPWAEVVVERRDRYETGIDFEGSTKGISTTVAARSPHSVATRIVCPSRLAAVGSQQNPMFAERRGE